MATHIHTLTATKCAIIDATTPNTHVPLGSTVRIESNGKLGVLCEFDLSSLPSGELIQGVTLDVYLAGITNADNGASAGSIDYARLSLAFDPATVVWSDTPFSTDFGIGYTYSQWWNMNYSSLNLASYLHSALTGWMTTARYILWNDHDKSTYSRPTINTSAAPSNVITLTVTTQDSIPAASDLKPIQTYVDGSAMQRLSWAYSNAAGGVQKGFQIQKSVNASEWEDVAAVTSEDSFYDAPAGTFSAGTAYWRVKVISQWDIESEWSASVLIIVIAAPTTPYITSVTATPRPAVAWQAVGQQAYQVRAGAYDSGTMYGAAKSHKVPIYLPDGAITVRVRVQNSFGLWSPWAEENIVIAHASVAAVQVAAAHDNSEITLTWTGAHEIYYVYRDGLLIAKTTERQYIDRVTLGTHDYMVRGAVGDAYDLSEPETAVAVCRTAMMAAIDNFEWIYLRSRREAKPSTSASISQQIVYQHYEGRKLPVADVAEYVDKVYSFDYSFFNMADADQAELLLGKVVVFKTPRNECAIGVLESAPYSGDRWSRDYTFTIRAVDYQPGVTYDV